MTDRVRVALVLGGADCLWSDIERVSELVEPVDCLIVACNDAGIHWPHRLDHWVTMHASEMPYREKRRAALGHPDGYVTWTRPYPAGMKDREANCDRLITGYSGSSGLLALGVAIQHAERSVLCGIPMDGRPHFNREGGWAVHERYREGWTDNAEHLRLYARSMSGWTADLLGTPTVAWLDPYRLSSVGFSD